MAGEKPEGDVPRKPLSQEEFERRDDALTKKIDDLETEAFPRKPQPPPVGGMF